MSGAGAGAGAGGGALSSDDAVSGGGDRAAREAEVYDRQIRLWGVEAQRRMTSSRVLIAGMGGLNCETCKNLVLAGINVTVQDTALVTHADLASQFFLTEADVGKNRAAASLPFIKELNPLASADAVQTPLDSQTDEFWGAFTLVILSGQVPSSVQITVDKLCRAKGIQLMVSRACGLYGYLFLNLNDHTFVRAKVANKKQSPPETIAFPTMEQALSASWAPMLKSRLRKPPASFFAFHALFALEASVSTEALADIDRAALQASAEKTAAAHGVDASVVDVDLLATLVRTRHAEVTPVCAVLGGMIGQEVVKAISLKDEPLCNVLVFDGSMGDGTIVRCG